MDSEERGARLRYLRCAAREASPGLSGAMGRTHVGDSWRASLRDGAGYANVRAFFAMLEQLGPEAAGLEEQIAELCAQPDPAASERCGV